MISATPTILTELLCSRLSSLCFLLGLSGLTVVQIFPQSHIIIIFAPVFLLVDRMCLNVE